MDALVNERNLGAAFREKLDRTLHGTDEDTLVCRVDTPVEHTGDPDTINATDWAQYLNMGDEWRVFHDYDFELSEGKTNRSTGAGWISDRIGEVFQGQYRDRLRDPDQLQMIEDRLQAGNHGNCTNALVAQVYDDEDLELATQGQPLQQGMSCLTQLQFKPDHDRLHLYQTMRSQYVDLKGYGNLVAAAALLARMCQRTDYKPGALWEVVHNATTWRHDHANRLNSIL